MRENKRRKCEIYEKKQRQRKRILREKNQTRNTNMKHSTQFLEIVHYFFTTSSSPEVDRKRSECGLSDQDIWYNCPHKE